MYLKALEIRGFKSFPDKTILTFGEDITAIVGPNGSGKSNISDAIRWVMGEQSSRTLRGGKMEDVIFGGTAKRRQTGFAEVTLVLDNTEHIVPLEEQEVMVTRRYYRSGESEYYINRRNVRLRELNELFMDTGLGREGYSMISQGRIDEILSVRSSQRREIFEEAAGISRFRHRKEESETKLAQAEENLVRIHDKISELELQVEPLKEQSLKAKQFLKLRDELKELEISLWLNELERLRVSSIKLETDFREGEHQLSQAHEALERLYADSEQLSQNMRETDMEAEQLRRKYQQGEQRVGELEAEIAVLHTNIHNNEQNILRLSQDLEQREGREDSLTAQIRERRGRIVQLSEQMGRKKTELEHLQIQMQELEQSAGVLDRELEQIRQRQEFETVSASEAKALLSGLTVAAQEILDRDERICQELQQQQTRLEQAETAHRRAEKQLADALEERGALRNVLSGYQLRVESRKKKMQTLSERHIALKMDENAMISRIRLLTEMEQAYEGYSRAVKLVLDEARRGVLENVHGTVAQLIQVPEKYIAAIETVLGGAMQNLVVDGEEDAKRVIQYLKKRDGGRVTIFPLDSVRPGQLKELEQLRQEPGFLGIGDQLIGFEARYSPVFSNLLGRVAVMKDLDHAVAVAGKYGYRFRIVTLDGQVLNPGGSMTGGSLSRTVGILSRGNELRKLHQQHKELERELSRLSGKLEEARRETAAAEYEMTAAQGQLRSWEDAILNAQGEAAVCRSTVSELENRIAGQKEELKGLKLRFSQIDADTVRARERIEVLEGSAFSLREEAESRIQGKNEVRTRSAQLAEEIAGLTAELAAQEAQRETEEHALREVERLREDVAGDLIQNQALMAGYEAQNRQFSLKISEKERSLFEIRKENGTQTAKLSELTQQRLRLEAERSRKDKASRDKNDELLIMQREISVLEQKRSAVKLEEKQILEKMWDTYELSYEGAKRQRTEITSAARAARRVTELKSGIAQLGPVNLGAIEEFERINQRYTYFCEQRDDVVGVKGELERIIGQITAEMRAIFEREFKRINKAFGEIFQELFGGGSAALELEDEKDVLNCGIEIRVQPPGKALKIITLLSGGEKAFVAIAIYFAILKVRPTPFVVMDEIDAALDDSNVVKFARYLRKMAQKTQFVVITHRRGTMEEADVLYGVTMQEQGVSRMLTINLKEAEEKFIN